MLAVKLDHTKTCIALIERGAYFTVKDKNGCTAFMWAAKGGHTKVYLALFESGADLNIQDKNGMTSLMWAVRNRHTKTCIALIESGADLTVQDKDGGTFLMWAVRRGDVVVCSAMLSYVIILPEFSNENCLTTILYIFKIFKVSKDMRCYILEKLPLGSLIGLFMHCQKLPFSLRNRLVEEIEEHTIEQLIPMMIKARERTLDEELRNLLDSEQFSKNFDEELRSTIEKVVDTGRLYLFKPVIKVDEKDTL